MASDLRQTESYGQYMKKMGWEIVKVDETQVFLKKLPLIPFWFMKVQRPMAVDLKKVENLAKKYPIAQIKVEPGFKAQIEFEKFGYKQDKSAMLPTKTIWLDLKKSEKQLLTEMHGKTRYNIRKYGGKGVEIIRGDKLTERQMRDFFEIYKKNSKKQKFWGLNFKQLKWLMEAFGNKSYLLTVKSLGGLVLLFDNKTAYYSHNAASIKGRRGFVPTILTWEAIKLSKNLGYQKFDFEGIYDPRFLITKKWRGFTRFKKGFGGKMIEYGGSFSKWKWL